MKIIAEHLGIASQNSAALRDWYLATLGAKLVFDNGQTPPSCLIAIGGSFNIEIYPATSKLEETSNNLLAGWRHLALQVESIEEAKAELEKKGVTFADPVKAAVGGGRVLFFRDPENNLLHFAERPQDSSLRL
jgi:glyoxylase I family protein